MGKLYNKDLGKSYLMYLDANNLYGYAMVQKLPTHDFKWVEDLDQFTTDRILDYEDGGDVGYLLEVDVGYPKELHKSDNELPFLPERIN